MSLILVERNHLPVELALSIESYLLDVQARNLRPATLRFYRQQLDAFATFAKAEGVYTAADITPNLIRAYLAGLQHRGLADSSIHAAARALRAWCNFMEADGMVTKSPMRRVKMPKRDKPKPDSFTPAQVAAIIDACDNRRDKALVLCLLDTGCRAGEFLALTVGDVNLKTGTVHVVRKTKNREERTVYLGYRARRELMRYLSERDNLAPASALWVTLRTGTPLQFNGLKELLRRIGTAAGVMPCNAHKFRRTFAVLSLRAGMDVYTLQKLMGHGDLQMLRHYLDMGDDAAQDAHGKYGPVDRLK